MELDTAKYFWLVELGNWAIGLVLMLLILFKFLRTNNEKSTLNKGNLDHDHCYIGYLFCAKVLGYQKCNLIGIPVPMQFKLIMNDIFKEYDFGEETDYKKVDDERIKIKKPNGNYTNTINLVLSDTYPISNDLLPLSTKDLTTIWISRESNNGVRVFSSKFYETIRSVVSNLPQNVFAINLYATLNCKHCWWIARNVFKQANRSNIRKLVVYPQPNKNGKWNFAEKGMSIFGK